MNYVTAISVTKGQQLQRVLKAEHLNLLTYVAFDQTFKSFPTFPPILFHTHIK